MIELFDAHAHFEGGAADVAVRLDRAREVGVTHVMAVDGSVELNAGVG